MHLSYAAANRLPLSNGQNQTSKSCCVFRAEFAYATLDEATMSITAAAPVTSL